MSFLKRLRSNKKPEDAGLSSSSTGLQYNEPFKASPDPSMLTSKSAFSSTPSQSSSPFTTNAPPTRRPQASTSLAVNTSDPPPAYTPPITNVKDDPYAFLSSFDTVFLIDDSGSMAGRSWRETAAALTAITPICTAHDTDGIDIHFLNNPDDSKYQNITHAVDVSRIFESVRPYGGTRTGSRLDAILRPYIRDLTTRGPDAVKPLNIIVITDGVPSDDVESVILNAAKKLEQADAPAWQVGIQFFQVGNEAGAADALKELDDGLVEMGCARDIVDTVPFKGSNGSELNAEGIMKVVLGSVNRKLDRKSNSANVLRS